MGLEMHASLSVNVGDWLKTEIVEPTNLGVSRQAMSSLLNGKTGLSADMTIRFEKAFGVKADTLLRMQTSYEFAQAKQHEADIKVKKLPHAA